MMKDDDLVLSTSDMSSSSFEDSDGDLTESCARFQHAADPSHQSRSGAALSQGTDSGWLEAMYPAEEAAPRNSARMNSPFVGQPNLTGQLASSQYPRASTQTSQRPPPPPEYHPTAPSLPYLPPPIYQHGTIRNYVPGSRAPINQRRPMSERNAGLSASNPRFHQWLRDNWQHAIEYVLPPDVEELLFQQWSGEQRVAERQQQFERALAQPRQNDPTLSEGTPETPSPYAEMVRYLGPEIEAMSIREPIHLDIVPSGPTALRNTASVVSTSATAASKTTTLTTIATTTLAPTTSEPTTAAPTCIALSATTPATASTAEHNTHQDVEEKHHSGDKWKF